MGSWGVGGGGYGGTYGGGGTPPFYDPNGWSTPSFNLGGTDFSQVLKVPTPNLTTLTVPPVATPGKLGLNFDTANLALSGLSTIGNLWAAFQAANLAKKQFNYTKRVTDANLSNQIQTYNTGITDRANNRAIVEGRDAAYTQNYIDTNSLKKWGG